MGQNSGEIRTWLPPREGEPGFRARSGAVVARRSRRLQRARKVVPAQRLRNVDGDRVTEVRPSPCTEICRRARRSPRSTALRERMGRGLGSRPSTGRVANPAVPMGCGLLGGIRGSRRLRHGSPGCPRCRGNRWRPRSCAEQSATVGRARRCGRSLRTGRSICCRCPELVHGTGRRSARCRCCGD